MSNCYDFTNALKKIEFKDSQKDKTKLTVLEEIEKKSWPTCNQKEAYFIHHATKSLPSYEHSGLKEISGVDAIGQCPTCLVNFLNIWDVVTDMLLAGCEEDANFKKAIEKVDAKDKLELTAIDDVTVYNPSVVVFKELAKNSEENIEKFNIATSATLLKIQQQLEEEQREREKRLKPYIDGTVRYMVISPPSKYANAVGGTLLPTTVDQNLIELDLDCGSDKTKLNFTWGTARDRVFDLIRVAGGHGGVGKLLQAEKFCSETNLDRDFWEENIITPLKTSRVKSHFIVLDACLTASMADLFLPLLAAKGKIICTMYSTNTVILNDATWLGVIELTKSHEDSYLEKIDTILTNRIKSITKFIAAENLAVPAKIKDKINETTQETEFKKWYDLQPLAREHFSIVRYLRFIIDEVEAYDKNAGQASAVAAALLAIQKNPRLGAAEKEILQGSVSDKMTEKMATNIQTVKEKTIRRAKDVLTNVKYGSLKQSHDLVNTPLYGDNSLSTFLGEKAPQILATGTLPNVPTQYAVLQAKLSYDRLLEDHNSANVQALIYSTGWQTPNEIEKLIKAVKGGSLVRDPKDNYMM